MKVVKKLYNPPKYDTIKEYINEGIKKYPNNVAFRIKGKRDKEVVYKDITYTEFENDLESLAQGFIEIGLKGKRIAIIGKNCYEWALTYTTTLNGVGITVPLDKGLPEQEIESLLQRSFADAIVFESSYLEIMNRIQERNNTKVKEYICMQKIDGFKSLNEVISIGKKAIKDGKNEYKNLEINPEEMAAIIFTSGTTSLSKAVMLSNKNIASNIYGIKCSEKIYNTDVNLAFLPFHHTFGSTALLLFLSEGVTNVFCDGLRHIAQNLKEYKVSIFVCVPLLLEAMYKKIMTEVDKQNKTNLIKIMRKVCNFLLKFGIDIRRKVFKQILDNLGGNIRFVISGASAIDKNVAKGFYDFGILAVQGYGLTETSPVLAAENEKCVKFGSVGLPLTDVEIKIDNPNEEGIGEIIAKGPNVMLGYYENKEATDEVLKEINGEQWFYTGDLGYLDKDGFLFITGRKKNVIVLKNGKNIYPEEIELLLSKHPEIKECMVYGKEVEGEKELIITARVIPNYEEIEEKYGKDLDEDTIYKIIWDIIKEVNKGLTSYKAIKKLEIKHDEFVKTTTMKIKRYAELKKDK